MLGTMVCHISALPVPMLREVSAWTLESVENSNVFVCFCSPEHSVTLFWSSEVSLEFHKCFRSVFRCLLKDQVSDFKA